MYIYTKVPYIALYTCIIIDYRNSTIRVGRTNATTVAWPSIASTAVVRTKTNIFLTSTDRWALKLAKFQSPRLLRPTTNIQKHKECRAIRPLAKIISMHHRRLASLRAYQRLLADLLPLVLPLSFELSALNLTNSPDRSLMKQNRVRVRRHLRTNANRRHHTP